MSGAGRNRSARSQSSFPADLSRASHSKTILNTHTHIYSYIGHVCILKYVQTDTHVSFIEDAGKFWLPKDQGYH